MWGLLVLAGLVCVLAVGAAYLLRYPQHWFRSDWVESYLRRQDFAKDWQWEKLQVQLSSPSWLQYEVGLLVDDLHLQSEFPTLGLQAEETHLSWDALIEVELFPFQLKRHSGGPLRLQATQLLLKAQPSPQIGPEPVQEPAFWKSHLSSLWHPLLPQVEVDLEKVLYEREDLSIQLAALKIRRVEKILNLETGLSFPGRKDLPSLFPLKVEISPASLIVESHIPRHQVLEWAKCRMELRTLDQLENPSPVQLDCETRTKVSFVSPKNFVEAPFVITAEGRLGPRLPPVSLSGLKLDVQSKSPSWNFVLKAALEEDLMALLDTPSLLFEKVLPGVSAQLDVSNFQRFLQIMPKGYREAPAPLTPMNGSLALQLSSQVKPSLQSRARLSLNLSGAGQRVLLNTDLSTQWRLAEGATPFQAPQVKNPRVTLDLRELRLTLPRMAAREPLPPLLKDGRIKTAEDRSKTASTPKKSQRQARDLQWRLRVATDDPITLQSSLLQEPLRLAVDLQLGPPGPIGGQIRVQPMSFEFFRRPIQVEHLRLHWPEPEQGLVDGRLIFTLPEYKIFLNVEGPLESPRTAFESQPPLSQDDIYSVLLFGRPMSELDPEGQEGMARVKQGLTQGLFSLSTLYLLGGSRIESLGFNADGGVSAQVRLDARHSVRVGGGMDGLGSVAVRRSLGGGWFIESQAQSQEQNLDDTNFGVMLQRVLAY